MCPAVTPTLGEMRKNKLTRKSTPKKKTTHDCDDEFAKTHANSTDDQEASTAHSVDQLNSNDGHRCVDDVGDDTARRAPAIWHKNSRGGGESFRTKTYVIIKGFLIPADMKNVWGEFLR